MRALVVEDSPILLRSVVTALRRSGFVTDSAADGDVGLWMACENTYDVIVLDVMLPKRDGFAVLAGMRARGRTAHVLFLTARAGVEDRIRGLDSGADDYLVKPFAITEMIARVRALCRRSLGVKSALLRAGPITLDTSARRVFRADAEITLTSREYLVLEQLASRQGRVLSRSDIEAHVYDDDADLMSNVVDSTICTLRRKIDAPGDPSLIRTRRGHGYTIEDAEAETPPA